MDVAEAFDDVAHTIVQVQKLPQEAGAVQHGRGDLSELVPGEHCQGFETTGGRSSEEMNAAWLVRESASARDDRISSQREGEAIRN